MGGFFGTVSTRSCVTDLYYGTDYNSHMGTKRGGMATYSEEKGFIRKETIDFTTRNGAERRDKVAYRSTLQRNTHANDKTIEETIERSAAAYAVKHDKI